MRKITIILLLLVFNNTFGQNEKVEFDKVIPEYILALWENNGKTDNSEFDLIELEQIKIFFQELKKKNNDIGSTKFLKKPTDNTLVAYYLNTKLKWNMFNPAAGLKKLENKKVIKRTLKELPTRYELLAFYYKAIFANLLNNQHSMSLGNTNIDLNELDLIDETEKNIVFLCAMRHLGGQITSYCSGPNFPKNCFRGEKFVNNMPKFNGKIFYEFELTEFTDFAIEVDKRYPKMSFKERFIPEFENAKVSYKNCLKEKN